MRAPRPRDRFDPDRLHAAVRSVLSVSADARPDALVETLARQHPGDIDVQSPWFFNNAGGAMGALRFLHVSPSEYLILFGSAIGTEGHSGRLPADDWFMILDGEQWAFSAGELAPTIYRAGDCNHLPRGTTRAYRMPARCWALEYARGNIPLMFPFGLADALTSTLDHRAALDLVRVAGGGMLRSLWRRWSSR